MMSYQFFPSRLVVLLCLVVFNSCGSYRTYYDCPPANGIGCCSLTEIEAMIEEQYVGPDLLKVRAK